MKSYNSVYKDERKNAINEQKSAVDKDRAKLIAAIKKGYCVDDFSSLDESTRAKFRNIINEMWNKETGLTEKGLAFVNEAASVLTELSTEEDIHKYVTRSLKANKEEILQKVATEKECKVLSNIKRNVEADTKKKLSKKLYMKWIGEVIVPLLSKKVNGIVLN